jgi:hypothetical protein
MRNLKSLEVRTIEVTPGLLQQLARISDLEEIKVIDSRTLTYELINSLQATLPQIRVDAAPGCYAWPAEKKDVPEE